MSWRVDREEVVLEIELGRLCVLALLFEWEEGTEKVLELYEELELI